MITPYTGELLLNPIPLELALHRCSRGCVYCFATLGYRHRRYTRADLPAITRLLADFPNRQTLTARLLQDGYPVLLSNHTDPFAPVNAQATLAVLETLAALRIPVALQTRGGEAAFAALDLIAPSAWYLTITTDQPDVQARVEPHSPSLTERLRLIDALIARKHLVTIGVNPFVAEWWRDLPALLRELKARGVHGICGQRLHLNYRQRDDMTARERAALGEARIVEAMRRTPTLPEQAAFDGLRDAVRSAGLWFFCGDSLEYSEFFTPYYAMYPKLFPVFQEFVNDCFREQRDPHDLISFEEFYRRLTPALPSGAFSGMSKYIGTIAHDFFWKYQLSDTMTFRQLLFLLWEHPEIGKHPVLTGGFAFPGRYDTTHPAGWIKYVDRQWRSVVSFQHGQSGGCYAELPEARLTIRTGG